MAPSVYIEYRAAPERSMVAVLVRARVGGTTYRYKGVSFCSPNDYWKTMVGFREAVKHAMKYAPASVRVVVWRHAMELARGDARLMKGKWS